MAQDRTSTGRQSGGGKLTPFGETARQIRLEKGILLLDMARAANVTPGFLSLVETGKKQIPSDLVGKIVAGLDLSESHKRELDEAAALSVRQFSIEVGPEATIVDRRVAHALQTGFARMSPKQKQRMLKLLTEKE